MPFFLSRAPAGFAWAVFSTAAEGPRTDPEDMTSAGASPPSDDRGADDARLVRRMAGGERDALAELYDRFSRPLYATAIRILNDATEAQDVVHDVFITLWEKASSFAAERGTAFSWAVTLTRNRAIDRLRSRRRRAELLEQSFPADLGYDEDAGGAEGDGVASLRDQARVVRAAVAVLPADQKRALELAFFGGLTQQEVAERLREPLGTVKARIRRGLGKLRDVLAHRL
jgi:RNA polymerase sigma-70 factor (ECF subfamily)